MMIALDNMHDNALSRVIFNTNSTPDTVIVAVVGRHVFCMTCMIVYLGDAKACVV